MNEAEKLLSWLFRRMTRTPMTNHAHNGVPLLPQRRTGGAVAHRKWKRARASGRN